eukprot:607391-Prymnesium_polylepis.1
MDRLSEGPPPYRLGGRLGKVGGVGEECGRLETMDVVALTAGAGHGARHGVGPQDGRRMQGAASLRGDTVLRRRRVWAAAGYRGCGSLRSFAGFLRHLRTRLDHANVSCGVGACARLQSTWAGLLNSVSE